MGMDEANVQLARRLIDALYIEAMVLADETRAYFDDHGRAERDALSPSARVAYAVESLKSTTRIMHVVAWLLTRRAIEAGEIGSAEARRPEHRLGVAGAGDAGAVLQLPREAQRLIAASQDLFDRVARIDRGIDRPEPAPSPARTLLGRLERAF